MTQANIELLHLMAHATVVGGQTPTTALAREDRQGQNPD